MAQKDLKIILTAQDRASKEIKKANTALKQTSVQAKATSSAFGGLAKQAIALGAGFFAIQGALRFLSSATREFMEFETSMRNANTMMRLSQKEFIAMSKEVENLSRIVPFTAKELSDALFFVVSAGISAENQMAFLGQAAKFAAAGATDVTTAIKGLVAALKGFGLAEEEAVRVSDLFFLANKRGFTTIGEMSQALQKMTSSAMKAGISIEQTLTFFAVFTGVTGNASEVATQFVSAIDAIESVSRRGRMKVDELNKTLGENALVFGKGSFVAENFAQKARKIWEAVDHDAESLRKIIPSSEAASLVIAAATTQFDKFNAVLEETADVSGLTQEAFEEQMKATNAQLQLSRSEWALFKKDVGAVLAFISVSAAQLGNAMVGFVRVIGKATKAIAKAVTASILNIFFSMVAGFKRKGNELIEATNNLMSRLPGVSEPISFRFDITETEASLDAVGIMLDDANSAFMEVGEAFDTLFTGKGAGEFAAFIERQKKLNELLNGMANNTDGVAKSTKGAAEEVKKLAKEYDNVAKKIEDILKREIELRAQNNRTQLSLAFDTAEAFVAQEEKVAELKSKIAKETDAESRGLLQAELDREEAAFNSKKHIEEIFQSEINEIRRRHRLTDFDREIEDIEKRRIKHDAAFTAKMSKITDELIAERNKADILIEQSNELLGIIISNSDAEVEAILSNIGKEIEGYNRLAAARARANSILPSRFQSMAPNQSIPALAKGGIITKPTLVLAGEDGREAIIPLSGNNRIGSNITVNITGGTFLSEEAAEQMGDMIIDILKTNQRV